jgi:hypothetical protein
MERIISEMLKEYECGRASRRHLIRGLSALAWQHHPHSPRNPTFTGVGLNHIAIRVTDLRCSRESETSCFLKIGDEFLTLFKNERGTGSRLRRHREVQDAPCRSVARLRSRAAVISAARSLNTCERQVANSSFEGQTSLASTVSMPASESVNRSCEPSSD